jgi:hypothetical protein
MPTLKTKADHKSTSATAPPAPAPAAAVAPEEPDAEKETPAAALIDGRALLEELKRAIRRYVVVTEHQLLVLALWVLHTHALDASDRTPYLHIRSATPRCGKSRLFDVLEHLVAKPRRAEQVTVAVLSRMIDAEEPTLLLDESDQAFKGNDDFRSDMTAILNGGIRRGGMRLVAVRSAGGFVVQELATFCPKALAGIGSLPDTIADRCIPIEMKRRLSSEPVERFYEDAAAPELQAFRVLAGHWAQQNIDRLAMIRPEPFEALHDRADEAWHPMFAIADLLSDEVGSQARSAAVVLMVERVSDDDEYGVRLLQDIHAIFDTADDDRLATATLIAGLASEPTSSWHHWWNTYSNEPSPGAARAFAKKLVPFGIQPGSIRTQGDNLKGYYRHQFIEAWNRYGVADAGTDQANHAASEDGEATDLEAHPEAAPALGPKRTKRTRIEAAEHFGELRRKMRDEKNAGGETKDGGQ